MPHSQVMTNKIYSEPNQFKLLVIKPINLISILTSNINKIHNFQRGKIQKYIRLDCILSA